VSGRRLARVEAGAGRPDVVLEAGRNNVAAAWQPVMTLLAPRVHVVAYDRAGLGGSPPAAGPVSAASQVSDLESVIIETTSGPCVLAGHSWGAILAQLLALRRPDLVAGLVLVDPAHEQAGAGLPGTVRLGLRVVRAIRPADELRGADSAAIAAQLRELRAAPRAFPDVPVVVLSAARGVPHRFRAHWTSLQAGLAGAAQQGRHIVVAGSGHSMPRDRPDAVAEAILSVARACRRQ
jgi:pimeloyl-ACP methyl ester carboxylesterase